MQEREAEIAAQHLALQGLAAERDAARASSQEAAQQVKVGFFLTSTVLMRSDRHQCDLTKLQCSTVPAKSGC